MMMVMSEPRSTDDEWTLIDKDTEFEGVVSVMESKDMGISLLQEVETENTKIYSLDEITKIIDLNKSLKMKLEKAEQECLNWKLKAQQAPTFGENISSSNGDISNRINSVSSKVSSIHSILGGTSPNPSSPIELDEIFNNIETELSSSLTLLASRSSIEVPKSCLAEELKICLTTFKNNEIGLFFPTPRGDFLAFHLDSPHHYLSDESKALIGHHKHFRRQYVLGRIILKEEHVATHNYSPFRLPPGTIYYTCSVSSVIIGNDDNNNNNM